MIELTDRDRAVLDLEEEFPAHGGRKDDAIRQRLRMSTARYYQTLGALIELPAAWAYAPMTIKRVRAYREAGRAKRAC